MRNDELLQTEIVRATRFDGRVPISRACRQAARYWREVS
jgi:hypothetical protein